ncbi:MAG: hypothetical protein ABEI98_12210 [Halorhabdus sp.]
MATHSLGRVLTVSFLLTLALPAVIVVLAVPYLAFAFLAGLATKRVASHLPTATRWIGRLGAGSTRSGQLASQ